MKSPILTTHGPSDEALKLFKRCTEMPTSLTYRVVERTVTEQEIAG